MTAGANRAIGKSNRFQRRLSSQEGREMASRVNREVVLWAAGGEIPPADPARSWNSRWQTTRLRMVLSFGLRPRISTVFSIRARKAFDLAKASACRFPSPMNLTNRDGAGSVLLASRPRSNSSQTVGVDVARV